MRGRSTVAARVALCSLLLVASGCSGDDADDGATGGTGGGSPTEDERVDVDCVDFLALTDVFRNAENIADGAETTQTAADQIVANTVEGLADDAGDDADLHAALETLGQVSFQDDDGEGGPTEDEVDAALATLEDAWRDQCPTEEPPDTTA